MANTQILLVEDDGIVAKDIQSILIGLGYDVSEMVPSGEEAIKKAAETQPDLVLMDIGLKGEIDGIEAAKQIRDLFNIPVIYLTAYADDKTLERAKATAPFGYILKPFEDRELHTAIKMALYKHKMENMLKESEERYRSLVENAHDSIYIIAPDGLQYVNPAFEKLTGFKKKELCSNEFNLWNIIHPDDIKLAKKRGEVKKRAKEMPHSSEFRIISKKGEVKIVEGNTVNIEKNGEIREMGILRDITERNQAEKERKQSFERLRRALEETVNALSSAVEMRDPYTAGHQRRVAHLAVAIAEEMNLSKNMIDGVRMAGFVHDVGKMFIPAEILSKPGRLSKISYSMIRTHAKMGYDILKTIEFPYPVAQIVLQHHERMDGSGYPAALSGKEMLLEARILAVADVVEAMASHRPYRPAFGIDEALEEITQKKGNLFDPEAVHACLKLFSKKKFKLE